MLARFRHRVHSFAVICRGLAWNIRGLRQGIDGVDPAEIAEQVKGGIPLEFDGVR
jgi:hypothetical protein